MKNMFTALGNNFGPTNNNKKQPEQNLVPSQFFQPQQFAQFLQDSDPFNSSKKK